MTKISDIAVSVHSHPFDGVAVTQGVGQMVKRDLVLVKITADDGSVGFGECHHGLNPTAVADVVRHSMAPAIFGADPHDIEGIWDRIYRHQIQTHGMGAGSVIALSGIDIALWDLRGKLLGLPIWQLMGGAARLIRAYAGGMGLGWQPPESLVTEVTKYMRKVIPPSSFASATIRLMIMPVSRLFAGLSPIWISPLTRRPELIVRKSGP